jgi:hypothetical protein
MCGHAWVQARLAEEAEHNDDEEADAEAAVAVEKEIAALGSYWGPDLERAAELEKSAAGRLRFSAALARRQLRFRSWMHAAEQADAQGWDRLPFSRWLHADEEADRKRLEAHASFEMPTLRLTLMRREPPAVAESGGGAAMFECPVFKQGAEGECVFTLKLRTSENPRLWEIMGVCLLC